MILTSRTQPLNLNDKPMNKSNQPLIDRMNDQLNQLLGPKPAQDLYDWDQDQDASSQEYLSQEWE